MTSKPALADVGSPKGCAAAHAGRCNARWSSGNSFGLTPIRPFVLGLSFPFPSSPLPLPLTVLLRWRVSEPAVERKGRILELNQLGFWTPAPPGEGSGQGAALWLYLRLLRKRPGDLPRTCRRLRRRPMAEQLPAQSSPSTIRAAASHCLHVGRAPRKLASRRRAASPRARLPKYKSDDGEQFGKFGTWSDRGNR